MTNSKTEFAYRLLSEGLLTFSVMLTVDTDEEGISTSGWSISVEDLRSSEVGSGPAPTHYAEIDERTAQILLANTPPVARFTVGESS